MHQWDGFKEKMDHELDKQPPSHIHISLLKQGYKLDGKNGIKAHIGCDNYKSTDYISDTKSLILIEFSDLLSQQNNIINQIKRLHESSLAPSDTRIISKKLRKTIPNELVNKYKDSLLLIEQMQKNQHCSQLAEQYQKNEILKKYWIVVAPFHPNITEGNKTDLKRFIDDLKANIETALPSEMNIKVEIISITDFSRPRSL